VNSDCISWPEDQEVGMRSEFRCFVTLLIFVAGGCATCWPKDKLQFELVDGLSKRPLEGVNVQRNSRNRMLMTIRLFPGKDGTFDVGTTGSDGMVVAEGLCSDLSHNFHFTKPGYHQSGAGWYHKAKSVSSGLAPDDPASLRRGREVHSDQRGVYTIVMYPDSVPVVQRLEWQQVAEPPKVARDAADSFSNEANTPGFERFRMETPRLFFTNGIGDYRVVWIGVAESPRGYRWEYLEVTPDGTRRSKQTGFARTRPRPEQLRGWEW
jgi:hypothetical protein